MQEAFGYVLFGVVAVAAVIAVVAAAGTGAIYRQIGRGGFSLDRDDDHAAARRSGGGGAVSAAERDAEVRQMLGARNERRARQGKAPLDVEAELARLTAPAVDPGLEAEVRQLVIARNERRERQGKAPLDVEAEVARQLRDLGG